MTILLLHEALKRTRVDELQFFQSAYYWAYQKHADVWNDVAQYRLNGVVPRYAMEYAKHVLS